MVAEKRMLANKFSYHHKVNFMLLGGFRVVFVIHLHAKYVKAE